MIEAIAKATHGRFDADPCIQHHFSDGLYAKQMVIPKGFKAYSHKHEYSHLSILSSGSAKVATDKGEAIYHAPACIEISAGVNHEIEALTDVSWFCIHATTETDAGNVDAVLIGA